MWVEMLIVYFFFPALIHADTFPESFLKTMAGCAMLGMQEFCKQVKTWTTEEDARLLLRGAKFNHPINGSFASCTGQLCIGCMTECYYKGNITVTHASVGKVRSATTSTDTILIELITHSHLVVKRVCGHTYPLLCLSTFPCNSGIHLKCKI